MPFLEINGAQIYYETYGGSKPRRSPILLIHGSTSTGSNDWGLVAPLLARQHYVIVPDCRGHGQSSNPQHSYSFMEMASDMAALLTALGHERAHIIGHSNGGNVALVFLMEFQERVQTAILQAANAWVSPDLFEREPRVLDPDVVEQNAPGWVEEMIRQHGPTHGPDYWRDLLRMTLKEILAGPNYTPEELGRVARPVLAIQGENDPVNAPARHAQFIARHIPHAEVWIASGRKHNIHDEALFEWIVRVEDFLQRRGDEANEALYRLKKMRYKDDRLWIFEPHASEDEAGHLKISGKVLTPEQRQVIGEAFSGQETDFDLQVMLAEAPWALVRRGITDLRREPRTVSERVSQGLLGEIVRILAPGETWSFVRMERDGYLGWMQTAALYSCSRTDAERYRAEADHIGLSPAINMYSSPSSELILQVGKLPFGVLVRVMEKQGSFCQLLLPDGSFAWVAEIDLLPMAFRPRPDEAGLRQTLELFRRFVGVPYQWGGRTPFGFDCSGLAGAFWEFLGVTLRRDADQQFAQGTPVDPGDYQPGDLLFFGEPRDVDDPGRAITHVAISLGGEEILHANGTTWSTAYNSLTEGHPLYRPWLRNNLAGARRYH